MYVLAICIYLLAQVYVCVQYTETKTQNNMELYSSEVHIYVYDF